VAVSNYISNFQKENLFMLPGNVSLIEEAKKGIHEATEIKDIKEIMGDDLITFYSLWNSVRDSGDPYVGEP
jgi:hypothetical protein